MGQSLFKKYSKLQNVSKICYCSMVWLRRTNLDVFIQWQYTRTILKTKIWGRICLIDIQNSKNFMNYCGMTRFKNIKLSVFRQYQNIENETKSEVRYSTLHNIDTMLVSRESRIPELENRVKKTSYAL